MKIRKLRASLALLAALALTAPCLQAQEAGRSGAQAAVPYPDRLRIALKENLVILTWTDSPGFNGKYLVFRSLSPIGAESFTAASKIGEAGTGIQSFSDQPPNTQPYFYAVLAQGKDTKPYQVFLAGKNTTAQGIAAPAAPAKESPQSSIPATAPKANPAESPAASTQPTPAESAATQEPAQQPAAQPAGSAEAKPNPSLPFVSSLSAKPRGDAIVIAYKASPKSRLVLYRGTAQIRRAADLLDATLIAAFTDKDGSFTDFPVPGVEYYYAILGEEDLKSGKIGISLGNNSLDKPVQVQASSLSTGLAETAPMSRTPPLPYFLMEDGAAGGGVALPTDDGPPPSRPIGTDTEKAISALLASTPKILAPQPTVRILPEEKAAPSGGEDYALSLLVSDRIAAKDWQGATDQLRKYLSLNRSPKAGARAHFYLGESLALLGSGRDAFFELLLAREFYPVETEAWIEYVLSTLPKG